MGTLPPVSASEKVTDHAHVLAAEDSGPDCVTRTPAAPGMMLLTTLEMAVCIAAALPCALSVVVVPHTGSPPLSGWMHTCECDGGCTRVHVW